MKKLDDITECGTERLVLGGSLKNGKTKSCGCLQRESVIERNISNSTHGHTVKQMSNKTYQAWKGIKDRCFNKDSNGYKNYGGRGISICERWANSFERFLADMGEAPRGMSIDRINNNGNYEPSNCKWSTPKEQANNRRSNRHTNITGKALSIAQAAFALGVKYSTLLYRINAQGSNPNA